MIKQKKKNKGSDLVKNAFNQLIIKIVIIVLVVWILFGLIFGFYRVDNQGMVPAIQAGDLVFYYRLDRNLAVSNVVVYADDQKKAIVGRIVALPGDEVDFDEQGFLVNGARQYEPKIFKETLPFVEGIDFPVKLGEHEYFILGDNRDKAKDSRFLGPVDHSLIKGKVIAFFRRRDI